MNSLSTPESLRPRSQRWPLLIILGAIVIATLGLNAYGMRQSLLFIIGIAFGISLFHASFGFASAYRKFFVYGETKGIIAQLFMLALATLLFAPLLMRGSVFGQKIAGAVAPVALQGAIGAFLFGVGMQLGTGCACGTLYTIGGGSTIMLITLLTFCIGSFWGSLTGGLWAGLPKTEPLSLVNIWGWWGVVLQLSVLGIIALYLMRKPGSQKEVLAELSPPSPPVLKTGLYGPWPLLWGAIALALLNWLTLIVAGRPWGVTWAFTLWAAKIARLLGWNPSTSEFWSQPKPLEALNASIFSDVVSVINIGVIIGAALAASFAGRLALKKPASRGAVIAAVIGGLLMGYGARLAFGCNVGAYFSGIASTSLHGWLWIAFALLGTYLGVKLRGVFSLAN